MIEFCDKENAVVWFKAIPEIERKIRKKQQRYLVDGAIFLNGE
jgi:hypothetical protein